MRQATQPRLGDYLLHWCGMIARLVTESVLLCLRAPADGLAVAGPPDCSSVWSAGVVCAVPDGRRPHLLRVVTRFGVGGDVMSGSRDAGAVAGGVA
jgi:hypothetical protein